MACGASRGRDGHSSCTPVARRIKQPTRTADPDRSGIAPAPFLFGLAPGGVCRAASVAGNAVRSYRTVSPLPRLNATRRGGLFSVALSLGRPRGAHPAGCYPAPFVRGARTFLPGRLSDWRGAAVRPTDGIGMVIGEAQVKASRTTGLNVPKSGPLEGYASGAGRVSTSARSVNSVEGSAMPSTRACRKWRWNAVTTMRVASS